jgi:phosphohistidine phosphatase
MKLFLIRHAVADDGDDDAARPLSADGERRFRRAVRGLSALGVRFDRVLHSPRRRAVETAELLTPLLDGDTEVSPLLTAAPSAELLSSLRGDALAVVGHEPHLSSLLAWLIAGPSSTARVSLKKGAVARLEGAPRPGGMRLTALLPLKVLRRLA